MPTWGWIALALCWGVGVGFVLCLVIAGAREDDERERAMRGAGRAGASGRWGGAA